MHPSLVSSATLAAVNHTVSCWTSPGSPSSLFSAHSSHVSDYLHQFCNTENTVSVHADNPMAKNWTIGGHNLGIIAEVNTSRIACQDASFHVSHTDLLCYHYLSQITDLCGIQYTYGEQRGILSSDDCSEWTICKSYFSISWL